MPLEGRSGLATVFRTGAPARVSDYARLGDDATARVARAGDYTNGVAVPIRVDGAVWGGVLIATRSPEPLPVRAEMFLSNAAAMLGAAIQRNASRTTAPVEVPAGV
jgi:GAF domain-containing protein